MFCTHIQGENKKTSNEALDVKKHVISPQIRSLR